MPKVLHIHKMEKDKFIPEKLINRQKYIDHAVKYIDKDIIKVFSGQRRVGKSYMLYQVAQHIINSNTEANIVFINKELAEYRFINTEFQLIEYLKNKDKARYNYLFIDEVQEIKGFENALRSLLADRKWDIWCSGSNASFLSIDIAGIMSGRSIEFRIGALSYTEFLDFHHLDDTDNALLKYLKFGGLPYLINLSLDDLTVFEYLRGVYNTILFKDIVNRHGIRNIHFLENLVQFSADHIGSLLSSNKISEYLKSQGIRMATVRVLEYLNYLTDAFFLKKIKRTDIKGKRVFEVGEKYFFEDLGLRNLIAGFSMNDIGKIIENAVLLHLQYNGFEVHTVALNDKEIDFVGTRVNEKIYVQVAYLIPDQKVYEREFGNLRKIDDNYPKYVVSMDPVISTGNLGIKHIHLREFLKMEI